MAKIRCKVKLFRNQDTNRVRADKPADLADLLRGAVADRMKLRLDLQSSQEVDEAIQALIVARECFSGRRQTELMPLPAQPFPSVVGRCTEIGRIGSA